MQTPRASPFDIGFGGRFVYLNARAERLSPAGTNRGQAGAVAIRRRADRAVEDLRVDVDRGATLACPMIAATTLVGTPLS
jgi:hypothetical protein